MMVLKETEGGTATNQWRQESRKKTKNAEPNLKNESRQEMLNYKQVSLVCIPCSVMEKIVWSKLDNYLENTGS